MSGQNTADPAIDLTKSRRRILPAPADVSLDFGNSDQINPEDCPIIPRAGAPELKSALGQKQTFAVQNVMSALPPKAVVQSPRPELPPSRSQDTYSARIADDIEAKTTTAYTVFRITAPTEMYKDL
jgi:hypothetical protein